MVAPLLVFILLEYVKKIPHILHDENVLFQSQIKLNNLLRTKVLIRVIEITKHSRPFGLLKPATYEIL